MARRNWLRGIGLAGVMASALAGKVSGDEFANHDLAAMSARLEQLERQVQAQNTGSDCGVIPSERCDCGWYAGAGVYFIAPRWTSNPALQSAQAAGGVTSTTQTDFDYGLSASPVAWIGYRGASGFGLEARSWWFEDSESLSLVNPGTTTFNSATPLGVRNTSTTAGDVLTFASSLDIAAVDMIGTYRADFDFTALDFGLGVRYARLENNYFHSEDPAANDLLDTVTSRSVFEGAGPTLLLRGRTPLTPRFTAIADLRYSMLFGEYTQQASSLADNVLVLNRTHSTQDFLNIFEIEVGAEYVLPWRHVEFFVDTAFVAQVWQGAGNSSNSDNISVLVDPETSDKNADMALLGLRLGTGVRF